MTNFSFEVKLVWRLVLQISKPAPPEENLACILALYQNIQTWFQTVKFFCFCVGLFNRWTSLLPLKSHGISNAPWLCVRWVPYKSVSAWQTNASVFAAETVFVCWRPEEWALSPSRWCATKSETPWRQPFESWHVAYCLNEIKKSSVPEVCTTWAGSLRGYTTRTLSFIEM